MPDLGLKLQPVWLLSMCKRITGTLPKRCGEINSHVPTDIQKLHFLARLAVIKIFHNVQVLKVTADVIGEIDAMGRVATGCSPVSGVGL